MRALIQRVSEASVTIDNIEKAKISNGLLVFIGIEDIDDSSDIEWLVSKIVQMRIFEDKAHKMNNALTDVDGDILLISQFTLFASTKKGNRPSFIQAARPEKAIPLYEKCIQIFEQKLNKPIYTGIFGADMKVKLLNDGPVTIWLDSKNKE